MEFDKNDLLVGLSDPFFWFLAPLFALLAVGVCVVLNYALMVILHILTFIYSMFSRWPNWVSNERRYDPPTKLKIKANFEEGVLREDES